MSILCISGCLGCSLCDDFISDAEMERQKEKEMDRRRKENLPTLRVSIGEILQNKKEK